jgi:predicted Zn-dependent protease
MGQLQQKFQDDFILLCEAGFIAVNQADEESALKLFKASQLLKPDNTLPKIGFGYLYLCKLMLKQACKEFDEVLHQEPNNEMAKAFLGISMALAPNDTLKGERLLEESAKKSKDPMIKNLAKSAFDFVEKFVKKSPTPVQAEKKQADKKPKKHK